MKRFIQISVVIVLSVLLGDQVFAQSAQSNVFIIQNREASLTTDGTMAEFDSLTHVYQVKVWDKNPYVISHKTVRHWWGDNNRDVISILELKSWDDITKVFEKNEELFEAAWSTEEARDAYYDAYDKYFTGKHSDEIYREVTFTK